MAVVPVLSSWGYFEDPSFQSPLHEVSASPSSLIQSADSRFPSTSHSPQSLLRSAENIGFLFGFHKSIHFTMAVLDCDFGHGHVAMAHMRQKGL